MRVKKRETGRGTGREDHKKWKKDDKDNDKDKDNNNDKRSDDNNHKGTHPEALDGVSKGDKLALLAGERLGNGEWLGEEALDLTGAGNGELVLLRKLVHTKNGNNVLEGLVVLEDLLHVTGAVVVLLADNRGLEDTGGRVKGIDGGVDAELGNTTGKHSGGIQVSERGGGGGIGQIISGHVDGLDGGDGTKGGGCDTLLEGTHVRGKGGLVADSGWDAAKKGRHLGTGLGEAEDVVNEKQDIAALAGGRVGEITKGLGNGQTSQGNTGTGTRGLVHLAVDEGDLGLLNLLQVDDATLLHLLVQIVTLTGALANTSKHRETRVGLGDVVDQLHDKHSLADTGTTEKTFLCVCVCVCVFSQVEKGREQMEGVRKMSWGSGEHRCIKRGRTKGEEQEKERGRNKERERERETERKNKRKRKRGCGRSSCDTQNGITNKRSRSKDSQKKTIGVAIWFRAHATLLVKQAR